MAEALASPTSSASVQVVTEPENQEKLVLKLHKPKNRKHIKWEEGVIDNEFLGRKSSKCCCIYSKPHKFGESDTESDSDGDDDDCCHEHRTARRRVPKQEPSQQHAPEAT